MNVKSCAISNGDITDNL